MILIKKRFFDMNSPWILLLISYLKKNIKISFTIEAPCDVNPCLNEGVCTNFYNETSPFYYCDCIYGYSGQDCQISKINIKFMRNPLLFIKKIRLPGWCCVVGLRPTKREKADWIKTREKRFLFIKIILFENYKARNRKNEVSNRIYL